MRISPRLNKSLVAVVLAAGALLAPATTSTAAAMPPCCGMDQIANYYSTAAMTTLVGQYDLDGECAFTNWGQTTPYVKYTWRYCATSTPVG